MQQWLIKSESHKNVYLNAHFNIFGVRNAECAKMRILTFLVSGMRDVKMRIFDVRNVGMLGMRIF